MSTGGTEKFLRNLARGLADAGWDVTFFYCDASPYLGSDYKHGDTNSIVLKDFSNTKVSIRKFRVEFKDLRTRTHDWINSDFFETFKESDFDIIITGRAGHPEYPFTRIRRTPIIDTLHLKSTTDDQANIVRVLHLSQENANHWIEIGGDKNKVRVVSHPIENSFMSQDNFRKELGITTSLVMGFHQRVSDSIFSEIPLLAFSKLSDLHDVSFVLLGGSQKYQHQAKELNLNNIFFLEETGSQETIDKFLNTLDIYSHGRKDGEINSTAIAEALKHGLPVVTHRSDFNNGHAEQVATCGFFSRNLDEYVNNVNELLTNPRMRLSLSKNADEKFANNYEFSAQIKSIERLVGEVLSLTDHPLKKIFTYSSNRSRLYKRKFYTLLKLLIHRRN